MKQSLYVPKNTSLSSLLSIIRSEITVASSSTLVTLSGTQDITGVKTFLAAPVISTITNTGTLTLPTSTGTLALVSQIPTNSTYVDLTTTQSIAGDKIFNGATSWNGTVFVGSSGSFRISSPSAYAAFLYGGASNSTLTLPNSTGTLALVSQIPTNSTYVDLTTTQTVSGTKSFTGGTGIATSGVYPRTSNSNQQTSTFTTPAIQIGGSTNDGIYSSSTDIIDIGSQGTNYISLQPEGIYRFVGGTIDPAIVFNQRIQVMNGANGAASPAIQIDNQNSGFYRVNQGTIGIGISGVATGRWSSAGLNLFGVAGTAGAPALVLSNDTTSGLYRPTANQVAISCSGAQVANFTSSGVAVTGAVTATTVNVSSSTTVNQIAFGSWARSMNINAGATSTFSDTFSSAFSSNPSSVQITLRSTGGINALIASIDSYNTTTLFYRVYNSSGSNFSTTTVNVEYVAIR